MEAVYFGTAGSGGTGAGPWVGADLEDGLFFGGGRGNNPNNTALPFAFVTAMVKGGADGFGLKGGDATRGGLTTMYEGPRPSGYQCVVGVGRRASSGRGERVV